MYAFCSCFALLGSCIQAVPWIPDCRDRDDGWFPPQPHECFRNHSLPTRINPDNTTVMFFGDSITQGWGGNGRDIFMEKYASLETANCGIGAGRTEHLLCYIDNWKVDLFPKLVVLNIGTMNGGDSVDDVVCGIRAVVDLMLERITAAKILLLGILPRGDANWFVRVADVNIKISKFADGQRIFFLDMFDQFSTSWGVVDPVLFSGDKLHLETPGYQKWADTMGPLFDKLRQ